MARPTHLSAWLLAGALLAAGARPAAAALDCARGSACTDRAVVEQVRSAVDELCPCGEAASTKSFKQCWKPVVKDFARSLGPDGFPKACRQDVTRALANSTCGRDDAVLCRKPSRKSETVCRVAKAARCEEPLALGRFRSCADTCDDVVAVPFPTTIELSGGDLGSLQPDADAGVLRFEPAPTALDGVAVGRVLVARPGPNAPAGLLRVVLAVERDGTQLTLTTAQAPIQLAYSQLHVRFARKVRLSGAAAAATDEARSDVARDRAPDRGGARGDVSASRTFDYVLFDGDGNESTKNDQIQIEGEVGATFDFDFALSVDWGGVFALPDVVTSCLESLVDNVLTGQLPSCSIDDLMPEAKVTFVVYPEVEADANVSGAAILEYDKEIDLHSETLAPILVGPLVFVPVVELTAELEGGASGQFSTGLHGFALFETSVTVSSKQTQAPQFREPELKDTDFGPNDTSATLHARAKVGAGARLNVLLFGVTGPYATTRAYGELEADILAAPCWSLHAGIDAELGVKVTTPALPVIGQEELVDWRSPTLNPLDLEIASGACDPPPDASTLPPGSGPDAIRLANPTYAPWSRTYASPVWGGAAGPGNSVSFGQLERTIDGHYLRSGYGFSSLVKFDGNGGVVWARQLELDGATPDLLRVRPTEDGGLLAVSRMVTQPILLTRLAHDGTVVSARGYQVPPSACNVDVASLVSDGAGGAFVSGSCIGEDHTFLLHASGDGATLHLLGGMQQPRINVLERVDDDLFLAGHTRDPADPMVAFRLTREGDVVYGKRYVGCEDAVDAIPSAAIVGSQGEITLAGSIGAQHIGLLARILPNGEVGFATFPGFGFGVGSVFLLDSLVELPTTGYVAGGSTVQLIDEAPANVPSPALVGFDAAGHLLWARRYAFGGPGSYETAGTVAVRLTDDGGALATAVGVDEGNPSGGRLWAFKPFAKDGSISFSAGTAEAAPLAIEDLACSLAASEQLLTIDSQAVEVETVAVTSAPIALEVHAQTAQ